jgi:hypothetical protein
MPRRQGSSRSRRQGSAPSKEKFTTMNLGHDDSERGRGEERRMEQGISRQATSYRAPFFVDSGSFVY